MNISLYPHIRATRDGSLIPVDLLLEGIQSGQWQDEVIRVRRVTDHDLRQKEKQKGIPYVTISGAFGDRNNNGLLQHSGLISMDLDNLTDVNEVKSRICCDPYVYACFVSISGTGLCVLFKINPEKHLESFLGLQQYIFENYGEPVDILCKDVSRPRYVSWDPGLYMNPQSDKFTKYLKREKPLPTHEVVFVQTDFDHIVSELNTRRIDITAGYQNWLKTAFAFCDKLGEAGRSYFHTVSHHSAQYQAERCDKQYTACLKSGKSGITIASFYYLAKQAGIETASTRTRLIANTASLAKKGKRSKESVVQMLQDMDGIAPGDSQGIVDQVFDEGAQPVEEESDAETLHMWIKQTYALRRNLVTGQLEWNGADVTDIELNGMEYAAKVMFPKLDRRTFANILGSGLIESYHPIKDFFARYEACYRPGAIAEFWSCIDCPTGFPGYLERYGTKWLVGMIALIYGDISPIMLVLCGERVGTGKTRVFIDLLPPELRRYFVIKSLSDTSNDTAKRDLEISMSKHWLILDDEMGGKSKRDEKKIKALQSLPFSSHRAAFDRLESRRQRISALCGTSNDLQVIGWDVGPQRRTVPAEVIRVDYERMNKISRIELFMEAYHLYKTGFDYQILGEEVDNLAAATQEYHQVNHEAEMIGQFFRAPKADDLVEYWTGTQIRNHISTHTRDILAFNKIAKSLKDMGIMPGHRRINGLPTKVYAIVKVL